MSTAVNPQTTSPAGPGNRWEKLQRIWSRTPRSIRFAIPIALFFCGVLAIYLLWGVGESYVALELHHNFKSAELKVLVDGSVKHRATVSGASSRRLFGNKTVGQYSKQLSFRPGRHTIEVELSSQGVEQSKTLTVDLARDSESVLEVSSGRNGLSMNLHEAEEHRAVTTSGAIRSNPATSMLFTLCGSVLSAIIGFYVQEFLRRRKKTP